MGYLMSRNRNANYRWPKGFPVSRGCLFFLVVWGLLPFVGLRGPAIAATGERILSFTSHIQVQPDASLTVTETIVVRATGKQIKRGIVRDFPTVYTDRFGHQVKVGFQVLEVRRDGTAEPYHVRPAANGQKVYMGRQKVFLRSGVHTYTLKYHTTRQLGFFKDFDELYWNVTGNGWTFPIDAVKAVIDLPPGARILQYSGYTGYQGGHGRDFVAKPGDHQIIFETTRGLAPREGLTVAVAWPKGVVQMPSSQEKMGYFLRDNLSTGIGLLWLLILSGFYLVAWLRVGRDPAKGTIIPLFTPPKALTPPAVRFLMRMGFDHKAFAAAVVDMGVRGYLQIEEDDGDYTLKRKTTAASLPLAEERVAEKLFGGESTLKLASSNHTRISGAIDALRENLGKEFEKVYFLTHTGYLGWGILLTLLAMGSIITTAPDKEAAIPGILWLTIWTIGCIVLAVMVYRQWQHARRFGNIVGAVGVTLFALPFFIGEIIGTIAFGTVISLAPMLTLAGMAFLNVLFYYLMKAPTLKGRQVMDQIEGFKMYLEVAEKDRLNLLNPPEKTPELFERYLPYALALDVENEWSEQFAEVLAQAQVDGQPYSPSWYSGRSWDISGVSGFSDSLGSSFASAISSSSSAPGSSSGSGGGGSSGGGGGGGGGSGW
jgi:uncharacterized membrane protein YgcG